MALPCPYYTYMQFQAIFPLVYVLIWLYTKESIHSAIRLKNEGTAHGTHSCSRR